MNVMQRAALSVMLCASFALPVAAAEKHSHGHGHEPRHGGIVVEVKDVDYELVARPTQILLYVRDHGKAVDVKGATAKLTLLAGTEKSEVALAAGGDRLEASGTFNVPAGTRIVAVITLAGKPAQTARFVLK